MFKYLFIFDELVLSTIVRVFVPFVYFLNRTQAPSKTQQKFNRTRNDTRTSQKERT